MWTVRLADVFFPGSSNPLVLHREFTTTLMCTFDLTLYPFDTQSCPMLLYVADYTFQYVSTSLQNVTFSGTRRLLEYRVTSVIHRSFLHENKSGQHIEIVITNLYGYYISGAYVPTMLLVIISYLTFFFDLSDFTNRIMVSLTSLLVLASLFSQIASGLPKTAYMKLIDVWFIFCILADFVMVFVLVVINSCMLKKEEPSPPSFHRVRPFSVTASSSLASYPSGLKPRSRLFHKLPFKIPCQTPADTPASDSSGSVRLYRTDRSEHKDPAIQLSEIIIIIIRTWFSCLFHEDHPRK
ncbi:hypothetical protein O3P69_008981 [Scylla paramamosain]|uniref:Neurotransmitter-gated ion-channel transmembrane domain-containing protein n=1 Tax=Scylla paramamosain TaxID=85552 RepID=A0AAW0TR61_SCYPA